MLILTRKPGESLYIGDNIRIVIVEIKGHQIRVGIEAPSDMRIYREEIYLQILEENKKAAEAAQGVEGNLEGLGEAWKSKGPTASGFKKLSGGTSFTSLSSTPKPASKSGAPEVVVRRKKKDD